MKSVKMYYAHVVSAYTGDKIKTISGTNKADVRETARDAAKVYSFGHGHATAINYTKSGRPGADTESYVNGYKVSLIKGNNKVGTDVYTLSFPAGCGCPHDCECYKEKLCYGMNGCFVFPNVRKCHADNWNAYKYDIYDFQAALNYMIKAYKAGAVRLLVAGDADGNFPSLACWLALDNPGTIFQEFTKRYDNWNNKITANLVEYGYMYPSNLILMFSEWAGYHMNNPYNIPMAEFVPVGNTATPTATACGGNCSECVNGLAGCIAAKAGDIIALYEHGTINAAKLETVPGGHVYGRYDGGTWYGGIYSADGNDDYETSGRTLETLICNVASIGGYTADAIRENIVID